MIALCPVIKHPLAALGYHLYDFHFVTAVLELHKEFSHQSPKMFLPQTLAPALVLKAEMEEMYSKCF